MRRWISVLSPALLAASWLGALFARLLVPGQALANRDIPLFHLPLRSTFRELATFGLPLWNPWLHGGQPVLSNPSYGAFYPPSWLVFAVPPVYTITLLVLLHGAIAFAGAWRLARHFGCSRGVAALAGVGYLGCGAYLSLLSAFTLYCSLAWFPWLLVWADRMLRPREGEPWWRPALLAGGALGLQLLNGEPSTVVMSGVALLALAAGPAMRRPAVVARLLLPFLLALGLSAVQILPTLGRLADSPRKGLGAAQATFWSLPPQRLAEVFLPRAFGDPVHSLEGNYFGWNLEDRDYPYVESLYPGLLLAVLGAAALLRWRIPRRSAWVLALLAGFLLALGRHNPIYDWLRAVVPVLSILRFPEKFIVLSVLALVVAGVLGWQRLLDEREAGRPAAADFPLAVTLVVLATTLGLTLSLYWMPGGATWFISRHGAPNLTPAGWGRALGYLRREGWAAAGTAVAVIALLGLCRWRRPSRRLLERLAVVLLAADLWHYGHELPLTFSASNYRTPSPLAASLLPAQDRVFLQESPLGEVNLLWRNGDPKTLIARSFLARLQPYSGLLWHIPYAFDIDFDLMLTSWGRKANDILRSEAPEPQRLFRYLGVWNVGTLLLRRTPQETAALRDPRAAFPLRVSRNPYVLPRFHFVPRASFQPSHAAALAAARADEWRVARNEQLVRPGRPPETIAFSRRPRLLGVIDEGGRIQVDYEAGEGAVFVAAMTFDRGWRASVDGAPVPVYPTAACQAALQLPAGAHRLELRYRERLLGPGALITLLSLAAGGILFFLSGRRRHLA
jgi:hypothetical protein